MLNKSSKLTSIIMLLFSTFFWGGGFVFVKWLMPYLNPFESNHLRFFLAAALMLPYIFYKRIIIKNSQPMTTAAIAAVFVYLMLTLQTWGLYYTSIAKAGFLTTIYVVIIPIILWLIEGRKFGLHFIFCCSLSIFGIFLLNNANLSDWNLGDSLVFSCAFFAAVHIIYIEKIQSKITNAFLFNAEQCLFLGVYSLLFIFMHDVNLSERISQFDQLAWYGLLSLSILSSILAFSFQVYAQKNIPSQTAGILFLLESPFAALLGYVWLGEALENVAIVGAGLVILASLLVVLKKT